MPQSPPADIQVQQKHVPCSDTVQVSREQTKMAIEITYFFKAFK